MTSPWRRCRRLLASRSAFRGRRHVREYGSEAHVHSQHQPLRVQQLQQVQPRLRHLLPGRLELVLRGCFAGNIFDLGAAASAQHYASSSGGGALFKQTRQKLLPRPWVVDDMDAFIQAFAARCASNATTTTSNTNTDNNTDNNNTSSSMGSSNGSAAASLQGPYRKAVIFVDNAGPDVCLGMLPLARLLLQQGVGAVVMAANELPSINDVTAAELAKDVLGSPEVASDPLLASALAQGRLKAVSSGSDLPVIDLTRLSPGLIRECGDADLVVLEGMGRAIETNLHAAFSCDSLKLGMVKHPEVAAVLGGRMYDCVCRFMRGGPTAAPS